MNMHSIIARTCDVPEEVVQQVLLAQTQYAAVHAVFSGPVQTPFGKIAFTDGKLSIIEQNPEFLCLTQSKFDQVEFMERMGQILLSNRSES